MSDTDGTTPVEIDVNTDDLNDFENMFYGREAPKQEEPESIEPEDTDPEDAPVEEEVEDEPVDPVDPDSDEPEADDEADEPVEQPKKNRKSAKERIQELANARREAEQKIADLEARLAKMEAPKEEPKKEEKVPEVAKTVETGAPDPDAVDDKGDLVYPLGEFDPRYIADLTRHTFRMEREALKQAEEQEALKKAEAEKAEELQSKWNEKLERAEAEFSDLRPKIATLEGLLRDIDPELGMYLAETVMHMEYGPEVLYYLADNPDEAQRIVASGPRVAPIALGRLEGQFANKRDNRSEKKVSKAQTPPPQSRGTAVAKRVAPDTDDLEAFEREFYGRKR